MSAQCPQCGHTVSEENLPRLADARILCPNCSTPMELPAMTMPLAGAEAIPTVHATAASGGELAPHKRYALVVLSGKEPGKVIPIEEPMAAAIGAGLPIAAPGGNMVVDIGGGTTDVAVISLGGIVVSDSLRLGGNPLDESIIRHIKRVYNLDIGERTAENIKIQIGSAYEFDDEREVEVRGRDVVSGLPKTVSVSSIEIRSAIAECVSAVVAAVKSLLERTPPELSSDIIERGIYLTGGGALLHGLDRLLELETGIPVRVADDPISCVAMGTGKVLEEVDFLHRHARSMEGYW